MAFLGVNLMAVLVAAIATMIIGFLWYSPLLFARPWTILMGYDPDDKAKLQEMQKSTGKLYGIAFIASLISAFVLDKIIAVTTVNRIPYGLKIGFAIWLGFVMTVQLTDMLFGKKPTKLFLINTGYQLVCYLVMSVIFTVWPR